MNPEEEEYDPQEEFMLCCKYGDEEIGLQILEDYPEVDPCKLNNDEQGNSPIHAAAANGLVKLMGAIVKRPGVNLNVQNKYGNTPLHYAALLHHNEIIKILTQSGADPKVKNVQGESPLYEACNQLLENTQTDTETVDMLIGPDSDIPKNLEVPADDENAEDIIQEGAQADSAKAK